MEDYLRLFFWFPWALLKGGPASSLSLLSMYIGCLLYFKILWNTLLHKSNDRINVNSVLVGTEKDMFVEYPKPLYENFPGKIG